MRPLRFSLYFLHQFHLPCLALRNPEPTRFYLPINLPIFLSRSILPNMEVLKSQAQFKNRIIRTFVPLPLRTHHVPNRTQPAEGNFRNNPVPRDQTITLDV